MNTLKNFIATREQYINTITVTVNIIRKHILDTKSHINTIGRNPKSVTKIEKG